MFENIWYSHFGNVSEESERQRATVIYSISFLSLVVKLNFCEVFPSYLGRKDGGIYVKLNCNGKRKREEMIWEEGIAETDLQSGTAKERKFIRDGLFAIDRTLER